MYVCHTDLLCMDAGGGSVCNGTDGSRSEKRYPFRCRQCHLQALHASAFHPDQPLYESQNSPEISLRYFLVVLLVPASSIYIMHNIFIIAAVYDEFSKFSAFASLMLLFVNYVVFEIYDWMSRDAVVREQNRLYVQQLELCSRQAEERESLYLEIRRLRHDMKNYLSCLLGAVQTGERRKLRCLYRGC